MNGFMFFLSKSDPTTLFQHPIYCKSKSMNQIMSKSKILSLPLS